MQQQQQAELQRAARAVGAPLLKAVQETLSDVAVVGLVRETVEAAHSERGAELTQR